MSIQSTIKQSTGVRVCPGVAVLSLLYNNDSQPYLRATLQAGFHAELWSIKSVHDYPPRWKNSITELEKFSGGELKEQSYVESLTRENPCRWVLLFCHGSLAAFA